MRVTLTLDEDVYEAARYLSKSSGESLGKVISRLTRQGVKSSVARKKSRRFPVFAVSADAPLMSPARIDRFIQKEGLF
jgi:hypothetical protein